MPRMAKRYYIKGTVSIITLFLSQQGRIWKPFKSKLKCLWACSLHNFIRSSLRIFKCRISPRYFWNVEIVEDLELHCSSDLSNPLKCVLMAVKYVFKCFSKAVRALYSCSFCDMYTYSQITSVYVTGEMTFCG